MQSFFISRHIFSSLEYQLVVYSLQKYLFQISSQFKVFELQYVCSKVFLFTSFLLKMTQLGRYL